MPAWSTGAMLLMQGVSPSGSGAWPSWSRSGAVPRQPRTLAKTCQNLLMRPSQALAIQRLRVIALAAARGARNVRVFGSVAKGVDTEGSDLDLLVDLPVGTSLLEIVGLQFEIEDALGVKVDLCTERELHPGLKRRILAEAQPL